MWNLQRKHNIGTVILIPIGNVLFSLNYNELMVVQYLDTVE